MHDRLQYLIVNNAIRMTNHLRLLTKYIHLPNAYRSKMELWFKILAQWQEHSGASQPARVRRGKWWI
jgi:hypothetical protein